MSQDNLKRINFIDPNQDILAKELLNFLWSINGCYDYDAKPRFEQLGYYVPIEQYDAYLKVIDIQYDLEQETNQ